MRLHHYSIHTERTYCDWIRKFILFHNMKGRKELLATPEKKIEEYLTYLAERKNVAKATQNQAMNALVFLYKKILVIPLKKTGDILLFCCSPHSSHVSFSYVSTIVWQMCGPGDLIYVPEGFRRG